MLLPREQSPWNCAYYLGAIALSALSELGRGDVLLVQRKMSSLAGRTISPTQTQIALAWLYLLGAVTLNANGELERCS